MKLFYISASALSLSLAAAPAYGEKGAFGGYEAADDAALGDATPDDEVDELNDYSTNPVNSDYSLGAEGDPNGQYGAGGNNQVPNFATDQYNSDDLFADPNEDFGNQDAGQGDPGKIDNSGAQDISAFGDSLGTENSSVGAQAPDASSQQVVPVTSTATPTQAPSTQNQLSNQPASQAAPLAPATTAPVQPADYSAGGDPQATEALPPDGSSELISQPEQFAPADANSEPPELLLPMPEPNDFAGAPHVPGGMRVMASGEAPEEYVVQPGDTLFDVCDQLLDEPGYWPKLWALNPEIKNPHFIFPGMALRFYPGDDETPPYLQVVTEEDILPIDKGELDESELISEPLQLAIDPPPEIPDVEWPQVIGLDEVDGSLVDGDFVFSGNWAVQNSTNVRVPGFIFAEERQPRGYVMTGREGQIMGRLSDEILIENIEGVNAGGTYSVLRPGNEVIDPESEESVGYQYYWVANVKIQRGLGDEIFVGEITDSRIGTLEDDILVDYISTSRSIELSGVGALSSTRANVVGFQYQDQSLGYAGEFAFIDRGTSDGVSVGAYLPVFGTPGRLIAPTNIDDLPIDYQQVGVMRIIDTTDAGAVGYIVSSSREIRVGDRVGRG